MNILRKKQLKAKTNLSDATIDRRERAGEFPRRLQLGPHCVGWVESEVDAWIATQIEKRDSAAAA